VHRTPFRLNEGIWLEDVDGIIPWDSKIDDLRNYLSPDITDHPTSVHLTWKNHTCLGLPCAVSACRLLEPPNPRAYHIYLETFHYAALKWCGIPEWSVDEIIRSFKQVYEHLRRYFGEATFSYPEYAYTEYGKRAGSLPSIFWELPPLVIGFSADFPPQHVKGRQHIFPGVTFGANFSVTVRHEPPGYESLKAEARAIEEREVEGARVDYVAW
jgi:hypothetical protein